MTALRKCGIALFFKQHRKADRYHRHNGLFHILYTHSCVLIVGTSLFDSSVSTAEDSESETDHGLCLGKQLTHGGILGKSGDWSKANKIGSPFFAKLDYSFSHFFLPPIK